MTNSRPFLGQSAGRFSGRRGKGGRVMSNVEPVRKQIVVAASHETCFRVFTEGMDRWWPKEHHVGKSPLARTVIEPRVGGRWYSICQDGSRSDTGKVLAWDPPQRVVLAWQLAAGWQYDESFMT